MPRRPKWLEQYDRLLLALVLLFLVAYPFIAPERGGGPLPQPPPPPGGQGPEAVASRQEYLFCTWNVENLFDDQDDPHNHDTDEDWFARHPEMVREKVERLAHALLLQNEGRGPDILAIVEVENRRAVELLRDAINEKLPTEWQYNGLVHRDNVSGRRIEPAILTRLPVSEDRTHSFGIRRILEARIVSRGAALHILASHWTSRVRGETEGKREAYADVLYETVADIVRTNPAADVLLSGDFNDEPNDPSLIEHLHAIGSVEQVRRELTQDGPFHLLDLAANLDPETQGTYFYNGRWQVLDHIVVSPGLLDPRGWLVLPETLQTENGPELRIGRTRHPWRFGGPTSQQPRGTSDHFALTVRLRAS